MISVSYYYWNPKTICKTNDYKLGASIHNGHPKTRKQVTGVFDELCYYHYNLEYFNLEFGVNKRYINSAGFEIDASLQKRYQKNVDDICQKGGCS